jgi:hypothetical protein
MRSPRPQRGRPRSGSRPGARLAPGGLATQIVTLSLRFRLLRVRIQELLHDWLGIHLSIGTIHQTHHEAAAVVGPAEEQWLAEIQATACCMPTKPPGHNAAQRSGCGTSSPCGWR